MELVKSLKQSKLVKYVFLALMGSIVLALSSKIKMLKHNEKFYSNCKQVVRDFDRSKIATSMLGFIINN